MRSNLKKSVSLILAALMVFTTVCAMFTSCSNDEEVTADIGETLSARAPVALTIYGVTGESTTPEAIAEVEKQLNRLSESEYATTVVLKLYQADEYEQVLDEAYAHLQHNAEVADFCSSAQKIADRVDRKRNKLLTEAEQSAKTAEEKRQADAQAAAEAKAAEELAAAIEAGEAEPEPIAKDQVDIVFINDFDHYMASINAEPDPVIIGLDEYLSLDAKILTDYIHPTLLSAAKINGVTYGLPINKGIEADTTYYLFDKELVEKYNFNTKDSTNFANIEPFLRNVKDNEPDVIPLLNAPEEIQGYDFYDNEIGHPIGITNPEFGTYSPGNCRRTYSEFTVTNFFETMGNFRRSGFLPELNSDTTGRRFAVDIRKGSADDAAEWEQQGYIVEVYKTARATTENTLDSLYAVSAYSKYPARCVEILEMLYTDPSFKNIFTFGVEGVNYTVNPDNTITRLNDDYVMDFMKCGNTFIGLLDEGMDPDYVSKAVAQNFNVKRHAFLAFKADLNEQMQVDMDFYVSQVGDAFETLRMGVETPDSVYTRVASRLDRGFTNTNVPGLRAFLVGTDEEPSEWATQFNMYKETIPPEVTMEDEKDLASYMTENKNE